MKKLSVLLSAAVLFVATACAQAQSVKQSGVVTPGHLPIWVTSGVIADGGTSASSPITSIGVTHNGGDGICINSALNTSAGWNSLCLGAATSGPATLSLQNYGTASPQVLNFLINGAAYQFPFVLSGILGPNSSVVNDLACWNNTAGTLLKDCANFNLAESATTITTTNPVPFFNTFLGSSANAIQLTNNNAFVNGTGTFRDAIYVLNLTYDTTMYSNPLHFNYGGRFQSFAGYNSGSATWAATYTSNIGVYGGAMANTQATTNGVSAFSGDAIQLGTGSASNEFAVHNPSSAGGSSNQSTSLAAVQGIVDPSFASADNTHTAYGIVSTNISTNVATAAFGTEFNVGYYQYLLDGAGSGVTVGGILMPASASGDVGSRIIYGANTYSEYSGSGYQWTAGATLLGTLSTGGLDVGPASGSLDLILQPKGNLGSYTSPTVTTSSIALYSVSSTNAAVIGTDTGGNAFIALGVAGLAGAQKWCTGAGTIIGDPTGGCPTTGIINATGYKVNNNVVARSTGVIATTAFTVGTLPAGNAGDRAYVTDATACATFGGAVTGGAGTFCPVVYTGAAWVQG